MADYHSGQETRGSRTSRDNATRNPAGSDATSRNTDHAQRSTPESERLDDATSMHDAESRQQGRSPQRGDSQSQRHDTLAPEDEGNQASFDGHHTEELPRTKGKNGTRVGKTSWSQSRPTDRDKH